MVLWCSVRKYFRNFLRESKTFYEHLLNGHLAIARVAKNGSVFQDELLSPAVMAAAQAASTPTGGVSNSKPMGDTPNRRRMYLALLTCHRCLIFLGDLERYYQLVGEGRRNWLKAERYYRQALQLLPENGNPHNQLAVVATYTNNNLSAVHRYFRSLAVRGQPFTTALQNLKLIFEKNQSKTAAPPAPAATAGSAGSSSSASTDTKQKEVETSSGSGSGGAFSVGPATVTRASISAEISDLKRLDFFIVKLYGMLYLRDELQNFEVIEKSVIHKLDELFFRPMRERVKQYSHLEKARFASFALQLLTGLVRVFCWYRPTVSAHLTH